MTDKLNAFHERRLLSRSLKKDKNPRDFHLVADNGAKIPFHKELLAGAKIFPLPYYVRFLDKI